MKIISVVGARPQFVKAAVISRAISSHNIHRPSNLIMEKIVHTGQHYDENMSKVFFDQMGIPKPAHNLGVNGGGHGEMTGRILERLERILLIENPDWVLVYGDTNSTLAGALAAKKLKMKVAHVEAGLRSYNMDMPEEQNRIVTDRISDLLFCPTKQASLNLEKEGFRNFKSTIIETGDVMLDAVNYYKALAFKPNIEELSGSGFALCTIHRAENTDNHDNLRSILSALGKISSQTKLFIPLHPRTRKSISELGFKASQNIFFIDPVSYFEMLWMLDHCELVLTDSGGLQKEAFFFSKPCLILRSETEWQELVDIGVSILTGADETKIIGSYEIMKNKTIVPNNIYGTGNSGAQIINEMLLAM